MEQPLQALLSQLNPETVWCTKRGQVFWKLSRGQNWQIIAWSLGVEVSRGAATMQCRSMCRAILWRQCMGLKTLVTRRIHSCRANKFDFAVGNSTWDASQMSRRMVGILHSAAVPGEPLPPRLVLETSPVSGPNGSDSNRVTWALKSR